MNSKIHLSVCFVIFFVSQIVYADSACCKIHFFEISCWRPLVGLSAGEAFIYNSGQSNNFPARNGILNFYNYPTPNIKVSKSFFDALIGAEVQFSDDWLFQLSVNYFQLASYDVNGRVIQGISVPTVNQFSYSYRIKTKALFLENKFLYQRPCLHFYPYFAIGLGGAWNHVESYHVNTTPPILSPVFRNNTTTTFAYYVGVGVEFPLLCDRMRLGLGYRFMDMGSANTSNGFLDRINTHYSLSQSHLYANEVFGQVIWMLT